MRAVRLLIIIMSLVLVACNSQQDKTTLTVGHTHNTRHVVHEAMEYMAERLNNHSGGKMELVIYPGAMLGSEREMIELLQIGSLSMTKVSASPLEGFVPEMALFGIPYLMKSREHFWQVLDGEIGQEMLAKTQAARLKGMGYFDAGSRSFYSTEGPILSPDDLTGKKIRVLNSPTSMATAQALGAAATPIAWGELYAALQQGVVDGAENNPPSYYISRHYEIAPYYSLDEHTFVPDVIIASLPVWNNLSEQERTWLSSAMSDAIEHQKVLWQKASDEALAAVQAAGVKVYYPDKTKFQDKVVEFHKSFDNTPVAKYMRAIKSM
ncbi:MAG: TRAP transporter substrate-binding protein [Gammaproteobacteria bacterium]|nr:TRAP transporter substrate-binding protein [Gammaproteobacteria bacterium]